MWTEQEKEYLIKNYGKIPTRDIANKLNKKTGTISHYAKCSLGLTGNISISKRKYYYDFDYFKKPNLENSYWAGFIAGDGSLGKDGLVTISLQKDDEHLLEKFKEDIKFTGPLKSIKNNSHLNRKEQTKLDIWGAYQWHQDLNKNWNITQNKVYSYSPPKFVNKNFELAFLIGLFDADGCWLEHNHNGIIRYRFSLTGTLKTVEWFRDCLNEILPQDKLNKIREDKAAFVFSRNGQEAVKIREYLNQVKTHYRLYRKWR